MSKNTRARMKTSTFDTIVTLLFVFGFIAKAHSSELDKLEYKRYWKCENLELYAQPERVKPFTLEEFPFLAKLPESEAKRLVSDMNEGIKKLKEEGKGIALNAGRIILEGEHIITHFMIDGLEKRWSWGGDSEGYAYSIVLGPDRNYSGKLTALYYNFGNKMTAKPSALFNCD